jgi:hypothetical protein
MQSKCQKQARSLSSARNFRAQSFFAADHRPTVVPFEERLKKKREITQQRFLRAQSPIECDGDVVVLWLKRPNVMTIEVAGGANDEADRPIGFDDLGLPMQLVGKLPRESKDASSLRRRRISN